MKRKLVVFSALALLALPGTALAGELPAYSAIDNVHFGDPRVSCEGLHNEDDCIMWRVYNNFDDRWSDYDPCGSFDEVQMVAESADETELAKEQLRKEVLQVKPAAGSTK